MSSLNSSFDRKLEQHNSIEQPDYKLEKYLSTDKNQRSTEINVLKQAGLKILDGKLGAIIGPILETFGLAYKAQQDEGSYVTIYHANRFQKVVNQYSNAPKELKINIYETKRELDELNQRLSNQINNIHSHHKFIGDVKKEIDGLKSQTPTPIQLIYSRERLLASYEKAVELSKEFVKDSALKKPILEEKLKNLNKDLESMEADHPFADNLESTSPLSSSSVFEKANEIKSQLTKLNSWEREAFELKNKYDTLLSYNGRKRGIESIAQVLGIAVTDIPKDKQQLETWLQVEKTKINRAFLAANNQAKKNQTKINILTKELEFLSAIEKIAAFNRSKVS